MGDVTDHKTIRSISETRCKADFCTRPMVFLPIDVQVEKPFPVNLRVSWIVKIKGTTRGRSGFAGSAIRIR